MELVKIQNQNKNIIVIEKDLYEDIINNRKDIIDVVQW